MVYKSKSAVYALNSYVWKLLQANLEWETWKSVPPIIPVSQQPEFLQSGKPFIVYGSAMHPAGDLYELHTEAISYNIYGESSTEVNNVASLLFEVFKRQDEAARDVNDWLVLEGEPGNRPTGWRGVAFGSIRSVMVEKAEPADEEGGNVSALVIVEAKYTVDNDPIKTTDFVY